MVHSKSERILIALFMLSCVLSAQPSESGLQTPAEQTAYQNGGTLYGPLMEFIHALDKQTSLMNVQILTETLMGRKLVLCVLADPPVYSPADLVGSDKPVVLIANNVHGGEVAGKDASLEIMRDLVAGDLRPLLDEVVVLNIPTLNPDGAEVNRRTNEQRFDMNRDYLKLESQEIDALVRKVINAWHPDIHVDTHHGGAAPYALVYQTCMNPAGDEELIRFGNEEVLPRVRSALRAEDYDGFWYSSPRWVDGEPCWFPTSVEPRKQHVYSGLANMLGFLFETPSNSHRVIHDGSEVVEIPKEERYRHQVRGEYIGLREMIRFAAERGADVKQVIADARRRAVERGNNDADEDPFPIRYEQKVKFMDDFWVRKKDVNPPEFEKVRGGVYTLFSPTKTTVRPWGYMMPPELAPIIPLLLDHEIAVKRISEPTDLEVEIYYANKLEHQEYFQGHYLKRLEAEKRLETLRMPAGSFFVPTGQSKSNLLCYLLEAETNDNLITWGYLDDFLQVTTGLEEKWAKREAEMKNYLDTMNAQERERWQKRMLQQKERLTHQRIPIYRVMRKTILPGRMLKPFNGYEKNRYIR